jgi:hypothetical protein
VPIEIQVSRQRTQTLACHPLDIERGVRQMLADKVSGDLAGVWLLVAEHLRLGTWDLLCGWTRRATERPEPRLALQLVHEAAVCTAGIRAERTLHNRGGFELANGLPFVAADTTVHQLLAERTLEDGQRLQVTLGKLRWALGHFQGKLLAIDPHRVLSHSRRRMRERVEKSGHRPVKMSQMFWALDADTYQPVCFTLGTASQSVVTATPKLLDLVGEILQPGERPILVAADTEHFAGQLFQDVRRRPGFDLLVPLPNQRAFRRQYQAIPEDQFTRRWAGFATAKLPAQFKYGPGGTYWQFVERYGERPEDWHFQGFGCTRDGDEVAALTEDYPKRWHVEEFFNANQALGWQRAGTMNFNIRYGQMSLALIAQTVIHQLRTRLGPPYATWDADHLASDLFFALQGDVRVTDNTILVTYYNAPNVEQLRTHYEGLPDKLAQENIRPEIPWLFNYKLDFRFC